MLQRKQMSAKAFSLNKARQNAGIKKTSQKLASNLKPSSNPGAKLWEALLKKIE